MAGDGEGGARPGVGGAGTHLAVKVARLAEEAVLLVGAVGAAVLVVAAVGPGVAGAAAGAGELVGATGGTVGLVTAIGAVPVAVAALLLCVAAPAATTGGLPGQAEALNLREDDKTSTQLLHTINTTTQHRPSAGSGLQCGDLVGGIEAPSGIDLVGIEVDPEASGARHHRHWSPGIKGRQQAQQPPRVLLQTIIHLHVVAIAGSIQLEVTEPQDHLGERSREIRGQRSEEERG